MLPARAGAFIWPNAAERIERQLASEAVSERRLAAAQIVQLPRSVASRLVPQALEDPDDAVRLAALDAAAQLRLRGISELVVPWLNDPERRVRMAAIELLRVTPTEGADAALGRALSDPDPALRLSAAEALGASKTPEATLHLLSHLDDPVPRVREAIARALAQLSDARSVVPLIGKVQDSHAGVRAAVARALGELGDARASAALVLALADADDDVRAAAARALGRLGEDSATLSLVSLIEKDTSTEVRIQAIEALGALGSDAAIEALVGYLGMTGESGTDAELREASIRALEAVGAKVLPVLVHCVRTELSRVRANGCARVLGRLKLAGATEALTTALRAGRLDRTVGLEALGEIGDPAGLPAALEYLTAPDSAVRFAAIHTCGKLLEGDMVEGRAVEPITAALNAPDILNSERAALARVLGQTRSKRAAAPLMAIARDADDIGLKRVALEALGALGPAGQHQVLLDGLDSDEPTLRFAAALALREAANAATAAELLRRLSRAAEQDRQALLIALSGAMAANQDPKVTQAVAELAQANRAGTRDALLEALGNARTPGVRGQLARFLAKSASVGDRAKLAEALAAHAEALPELLALVDDPDGSVRANAAWSLGAVATARERSHLARLLKDRDVAVAGNAAASLGRLARRAALDVGKELCAVLADPRSYVRANALAALRLSKRRCPGFVARDLLRSDTSRVVRGQAAALLLDVPASDAPNVALDQRALRRCVAEEPIGSVAARCKAIRRTLPPAQGGASLTVLVVPSGESAPVPRAPFALRRADGLLRLGLTDRRGAVYEQSVPRGELSLMVPAPLVD